MRSRGRAVAVSARSRYRRCIPKLLTSHSPQGPSSRGPEPKHPKNGLRNDPENTHLCAPRRAIRRSSTPHPLTPAKSHPSIGVQQIYLSLPTLRDNSSRNLFHHCISCIPSPETDGPRMNELYRHLRKPPANSHLCVYRALRYALTNQRRCGLLRE